MNDASSSKPPFSKQDRFIYLSLTCFLTCVAVSLAFVLDGVSKRAVGFEWDLEIQEVLFAITIPDEALYFDTALVDQVTELRRGSLATQGRDQFLPYYQLRHPTERLLFLPGGIPVESIPVQGMNSAHSLEQSWIRESFRACNILAAEAEFGDGLGNYLKENPEKFDEQLRAGFERLLDCTHPWPKRGACMVLLAFGDRNQRIHDTLRELKEERQFFSDTDREHIQELLSHYGFE